MSDDEFFDDSLALDDAAWEQIDALSANRPPPPARPPPAPAPPRAAPAGVSFRPAQQNAVAGPSRAVSGSSFGGGLRQSTLYGTVTSNAHSALSTSSSKKDHTGERLFDVNDRPSTQGLIQKAGKVWDPSDFARYGAKGKAAAWDDEDDEENDEQEDDGGFEQFPAPVQNLGELPRRMKHAVDEEEAKTWVYPINLCVLLQPFSSLTTDSSF